MQQPKVTGYRQLTEAEAALMNEGKALAQQVGDWIAKLRAMPATPSNGVPILSEDGRPSIDQRWVSIGATDLQKGFMCTIRGIAQPTTF